MTFHINKRQPCRESSCCDSWKSLFNCPRSCWWSGHQHRILPSNFYWKTSDASRQCKIHAAFIDWRSEREPCWKQKLLANANGNENFLRNIITGDETWVQAYDVETKMQLSQWMEKGSPWSKNARMSRSKIKVFVHAWRTEFLIFNLRVPFVFYFHFFFISSVSLRNECNLDFSFAVIINLQLCHFC